MLTGNVMKQLQVQWVCSFAGD